MKKITFLLILLFLSLPSLLAQRLIREGLEALRQQNYEDATNLLQKAVETYPNDQKAYLYLYFSYMAQEKYTLAEGILLAGVEIPGPDTNELYYHLGNLMFQRGEWDFAIKYYSRSLELQENYSPSLLNRANALVEAGSFLEQAVGDYVKAWEDFRLAILDYSAFLSLNPTTPKKEEINQMVNLLKGKEQELLDLQKAKELAQQQKSGGVCGGTLVSGCQNSPLNCEKAGEQKVQSNSNCQDQSNPNLPAPQPQVESAQRESTPGTEVRQQESTVSSSMSKPNVAGPNNSANSNSQSPDKGSLQPKEPTNKEPATKPPSSTLNSKKSGQTNSDTKNVIPPSPNTTKLPNSNSLHLKENKGRDGDMGGARPSSPSRTSDTTTNEQQIKNKAKQKLLNSLFHGLKEDVQLLKEKNLLNVLDFSEEITIDE